MIYDLPKIEAIQIEKAHKDRLYRVERDRLKSRCFIYLNYPKINYHGLNLNEAKRYVYADFIARYERMVGRNVLFSIGYNNIDSSIFHSINKFDKPLYNFCASQFLLYQKELKLLDISFDEEKEIILSDEEYIKYVQQVFLFLYEKNLISLKHGKIVYDEKKIYQKGEYYIEDGKYFSLTNDKLECAERNYYVLKISSIKKDLEKEIENLNISQSSKLLLLNRFCYQQELKIKCNTTTLEEVVIIMENPEFICGISYICLNPSYIDIKPFITKDEYDNIDGFISSISNKLLYTGANLINPIINNQIPIFVSTKFDEKVHIGIPSLSDFEENLVNEYELDFNPVFDYINGECILVNSGRFNGLNLTEAHEVISDYLVEEGIATLTKEIKLEELVISSFVKFGIPVPLHVDQSPAQIPVVYNLRHDVRVELGELADKSLVREFLCDDFVKYLLPNAIRLKDETGILDFESIEAINEIGLFRNLDLSLLKSDEYLSDILWNLVFNCLFARYYAVGFDCPFKEFLFVKPILDNNLQPMHRNNNNLVSISNLICEKGASVIRAYYAVCGCNEEDTIYSSADIEEVSELVDKIVKVYYYPIDDSCIELAISYQKLIENTKLFALQFDFKNYFESIIAFVKKVHEIKHISRAQAKGLLIILSIITPSLAEQIKQDVLNLKDPLYFYSWPE